MNWGLRRANPLPRAARAGGRYRGLRSVFAEEDAEMAMETAIAGLVAAVRADEYEEDRSAKDVYKTARTRRRRLGLLSFGAGPLAGTATQVVDLYCETALLADLADLNELELSNHEVGADVHVMWGLTPDYEQAAAIMAGDADRSLAAVVSDRTLDGAGEYLPEKASKADLMQALWRARSLPGQLRGKGNVTAVVLTGHRTKQLIKQAERHSG